MPTLYKDAKIVCECGNVITTKATIKEIRVELCSACHPFSTAKQTAGKGGKKPMKRS